MKISKGFALTLLLLIIPTVAFVSAGYWIYSTTLSLNLGDYSVTMTEVHNGLEVTFSGKLSDPSGNPVEGALIIIYQTDDLGNIQTNLGAVTTDLNGDYSFLWTGPSIGQYNFKAGYFVGTP